MVETSGMLWPGSATAATGGATVAAAIVRVLRMPPRRTGSATAATGGATAIAAVVAEVEFPMRPPHRPGAAQPQGSEGQQLSAAPSTITAASALIHSEIHLQPHY